MCDPDRTFVTFQLYDRSSIEAAPRTDFAISAYRDAMLRVHERRRRLAVVPAVGLAVAFLLAVAAVPASAARPYRMDLGEGRDFVPQTNLVQCVGASMQMMINMMRAKPDRTAATQLRYQQLARTSSGPRAGGFQRRGASIWGWSAGLTKLGAGPYRVVGASSINEAVLIAAQAMRITRRPVGLLMWRGRHAWVMSGFRATADPLLPRSRVTSVIVEDPLYPRDSPTWGPSPAPGARLTLAQLGRQFVPRRQSTRSPQLSGKYVVLIPYEHHYEHRLER
jgi:hypothetical protein